MDSLDSELLDLDGVGLDDSLVSVASAGLALDDDDWLLGGLADLDDLLGSLDDLLFLLDLSGDDLGVGNSDSLLLSDQMSLGLVASGDLDLESLSLNWGFADRDLVLELGSLDLLLSDSLLDLQLLLDELDLLSDGLGGLLEGLLLLLQDLLGVLATTLGSSNLDDDWLVGLGASLDENLDLLNSDLSELDRSLVGSDGGSGDLSAVGLDDLVPSLD